ncbi:AA_TRNA_LIGASE_II domain-containing protein, partial [Meloidogyne graminicola]
CYFKRFCNFKYLKEIVVGNYFLFIKYSIISVDSFFLIKVLSSSIRINDLLNESEPIRDIVIQGWVRHAQRFGKMLFLKLNDGTCHHQLQAVVPPNNLSYCSRWQCSSTTWTLEFSV